METSPNAIERRWMDLKAAATYLCVTVHFVRGLLWGGKVPFVRMGKKFVVDRADLDAWALRSKEQNRE